MHQKEIKLTHKAETDTMADANEMLKKVKTKEKIRQKINLDSVIKAT